MEVSRQTALEVFNLKEGFTQDDLKREFRRLSKLVHPDHKGDTNLFNFIMCCKETLSNNVNNSLAHEKGQSKPQKVASNIYLTTLYDIYYKLSKYTNQYNIMYITSIARVHITPCRKRKQCESISVKLQQPFYEFEQSGFVNFTATITMSETLKKFKRFKVRVEFMGKTFQFKLSMKKPFYIVKYESFLTFNSIIELKFE